MELSLKQLVMYAGASGDFNEIHYNFDVAKKSGFDRPIIHGMLTMALCINEIMKKYQIDTRNIKKVRASFKAPILVGENMEFEITEETSDEVKKIQRVICVCKTETKIAAECEVIFTKSEVEKREE